MKGVAHYNMRGLFVLMKGVFMLMKTSSSSLTTYYRSGSSLQGPLMCSVPQEELAHLLIRVLSHDPDMHDTMQQNIYLFKGLPHQHHLHLNALSFFVWTAELWRFAFNR
eukprot:1142841-Pelagomonas_calceolata.AAC.1